MAHNKLYRNFIILQEDEKGHGISEEKPLSGYAKIEAKGDKCKISFYAQNLNKDDKYTIVLICYKKDLKQIVDLGSLEVTDVGKGEACKEYYINNIAGLDFSYEKVSGAAICKYKDGELSFLMYGFMNGENVKDDWKKCKTLKHADKDDKILKEDIPKVEVALIKEKESKKEVNPKKDCDDNLDKGDPCESQYENLKDIHKEEHHEEHHEDKHKEHHEDKHGEEHEKNCEEKHIKHSEDNKEDNHIHQHKEKYKNKDDYEYDYYGDEEYGFMGDNHNERIDTGSKFDDYEDTIEKSKYDEENFNLDGDVGRFFTEIMSGFEEYSPRSKDIKYCKWYKVNVNSLDDMCNTSNYNKYTVAYYPMLNYYPYIRKYGYFLIGYKCDPKGNLKYIVYGVPGQKDENEQPYSGKTGFVTWMKSGERNEGCWLMFYDFRNSTIVVPMK
ncbi:hypothetical protein NNC19_06570 [Clostridium sp. SHJSY1]|uniref:hypothetical protein n=1 Tax=Clostridium sp. SHJSY1 TaxID=2942483 RepID=UPI00287665CA|nr:hypothetical protein [Clostridium sp. SHJSY1]MDS0525336.1 hypothetical protein [Clostridium sp. SHJSY1]